MIPVARPGFNVVQDGFVMRKTITWVVVANGTKARVLENTGPGRGLVEVEDGVFAGPNRPDREVVSDRPGRTFDSHGVGRHAKQPRSDPARHERHAFLRGVADWLDKACAEGRCDRIVVVAAPHALGGLRAELSPQTRAKVVGDLDKDLVAAPAAAIVDALDGIVLL